MSSGSSVRLMLARSDASTLRCAEAREFISQYAAGSLDEGTAKLIEAHLDGCDPCARELLALRREDDLISDALAEIRPNDSFRVRVSKLCGKVQQRAEGIADSVPQSGWTVFRWSAAVAVSVLFAVLSLRTPGPQPEALRIAGMDAVQDGGGGWFFWATASVFAMALFLLLGSTLVNRIENWIAARIGNRPERNATRLEVLTLEAMGLCGALAASAVLFFIRG